MLAEDEELLTGKGCTQQDQAQATQGPAFSKIWTTKKSGFLDRPKAKGANTHPNRDDKELMSTLLTLYT